MNDNEVILNVFDNVNKTTEHSNLSLDAGFENAVISVASSRCTNIWPSGYTGKVVSLSGHSYAHNWGKKQGISRLGMRDIIVNLPDKKFDEYTRVVDDLKSQEKSLIPIVGGAQGLGELIKAIGKGKVTVATLKSILKKLGKSIPGIGTLVTMVTHFNTHHKANVIRDSLKGKVNQRGFSC